MEQYPKKKGWAEFFYDSEEGKIMGRTCTSWGLILAFYLCFYACLVAWMVICIAVFFETLNNTDPKYAGEQSLTQDNPGLGFRPLPVYSSTLIRFQQGKPSSYKPYTDHLEAFLLQYENDLQFGRNLIECSVSQGFTKKKEDTCRIDLDKVIGKSSCTKEKDFGYEDGEPCILLKMNRVFGFTPEPYRSLAELMEDNELKHVPRFLAFTPNLTVAVSCEGVNPADRENIIDGGVVFSPSAAENLYEGFPVISYPFLNQEGYRSPFVMIQFRKFTKRVVIQVECKMYARNIDNSGTTRRHGIMRFELLKD